MKSFLFVFLGGGLGSMARYAVSLGVLAVGPVRFPWATLLANILACVVMALFLLYAKRWDMSDEMYRLLILVGFCGGFSTFSTFSLENHALLKAGQYGFLGLNISISVVLCMAVFWYALKEG
jgi:CrcB protein